MKCRNAERYFNGFAQFVSLSAMYWELRNLSYV